MLPAHAGMIPQHLRDMLHTSRAPRTCGDDPSSGALASVVMVVLPAHAGMIPRASSPREARPGAPRTCGDDPDWTLYTVEQLECSPHMRG